ncbi:MAG TPA: EAL domain-containing protein [Anaerolineales bacterium]|nr:EAL domain-containing protein [Anaerolineales bacterium]
MREAVRVRSTTLLSLAALFTVILLGIDFAVFFLLTDQSVQQKLVYSDIISLVVDFLATGVLLIAAKQSASHSKRLAVAWGMIALSTFAYTLGDMSWAILEVVLLKEPFPSIADVFYLAYYPLLLIGVLLLPDRSVTRGEQVNKVLDVSIVMIAAILGFWNFLLGPLVASNVDLPWLELAILLAYPVFDLVLLWVLLQLIYNRSDPRDSITAFLLAGSIAVTIISDCIYTYQALMDAFVSGGILDIGWRAAILLAGLAGVSQIRAIQSLQNPQRLHRWLEVLIDGLRRIAPYFSYFWLIAAYLLLIQSRLIHLPMNFFLLSLGVGLIICLVLLRQIIMLFENAKLNTQLQQAMEKLQIQSTKLEKTNRELQSEIGERKEMEKLLIHDSLHDAMTGLPNRVLFLDRLGQAIQSCKRRTGAIFSVLFIDLDQFKVINDSLGHLTGDQLLISIGKRMRDCLRSSDTVARFGGDEFAILLEITGNKNSAPLVAAKLLEAIKRPLKLDGHELYVTASMGLMMNIMGYDLPEDILRDADIAMYHAKASGKAHFEIFDVKMRSQAFSRLETEQQLRAALENQEFQLYYQPIISLKTNALVSFEALIRWHHPKRGVLLPNEFLPIAEASGLILSIENWVLNEACAQLTEWHEKYPYFQHVSVNVNVSGRQFAQPHFVAELVEALQRNKLKPEFLKLEITEGVLISNYSAANDVFTRLRDLGVQLQIDDFGSGYSSLGYLQHFPISAVKIDKSFIDGMGKGRKGTELIRAIVSMTRELEMEATAEGIETSEQLDELKSLLCNFGQGFLLSKPLDKASAEKNLREWENGIVNH